MYYGEFAQQLSVKLACEQDRIALVENEKYLLCQACLVVNHRHKYAVLVKYGPYLNLIEAWLTKHGYRYILLDPYDNVESGLERTTKFTLEKLTTAS